MTIYSPDPTLGPADAPQDFDSLSTGWGLGAALGDFEHPAGSPGVVSFAEMEHADQPVYGVTGRVPLFAAPDAAIPNPSPVLSAADANAKYSAPGLTFTSPTREDVAQLQQNWKLQEIQRNDTLARADTGILPGSARFVAGMVGQNLDPLALASNFVPVFGEERYAALAADYGTSAARIIKGGTEGLVGNAAITPLRYVEAQREGADYDASEALSELAFGAVAGAGLHFFGGMGADLVRQWRGVPQEVREGAYNQAAAALVTGTPVRTAEIADAAVPPERLTAAALKVGDQVFTGQTHGDAYEAALAAGIPEDDISTVDQNGFVTSTGRYVGREDALSIAQASGQKYRQVANSVTSQGTTAPTFEEMQAAKSAAGGGEVPAGVEPAPGASAAATAPDEAPASSPAPPAPPTRTLGIPGEVAQPVASLKGKPGIATLRAHPDYEAAKGGDTDAAARLVKDLVRPEDLAEARKRFGADATYVPVVALDDVGHNKIPRALASLYASETEGEVSRGILQTTRAQHTGADAVSRLVRRPRFDGPIQAGARYVLVDDVKVLGSTLSELANHIRENGGEVAGVVSLVDHSRAKDHILSSAKLAALEGTFGHEIRQLGIEPSALTADEANAVLRHGTADKFRARVAEARGRGSGEPAGEAVPPAGLSEESRELTPSENLPSRPDASGASLPDVADTIRGDLRGENPGSIAYVSAGASRDAAESAKAALPPMPADEAPQAEAITRAKTEASRAQQQLRSVTGGDLPAEDRKALDEAVQFTRAQRQAAFGLAGCILSTTGTLGGASNGL